MVRRVVIFLLFFVSSSAASTEKSGKILYLMGEVLHVHQWYFLGNDESIQSIARYLARNMQYTMVSPEFDARFCETHGTIIVTGLPFLWTLRLFKDDAPECTWIVMGPGDPEWLDRVPPMRTLLIFYDPNPKGARLTLVQKPCWKCPLLTKSLEVEDSVSYDFQSFFRINHEFLNDSIVDVSLHDVVCICDPLPLYDPIALTQCYHLEIIDMVARKIKFRPHKVLPVFPDYSVNFPNGSHGEVFQQLLERSIDMSAASLVVAKRRMHFCESVWPTFAFKAKFFIKAGNDDISWLGYLYPFNKNIWLAISGIIAAGSFILILITSHIRHKNNQRQLFILFPIFYILQILCLQSLVRIPNLISSKIAYFSMLIAAATILPAYSGSLVSFLTTSKEYYPFTTLEEFTADGRFQILTRESSFIHNHLLESQMSNLTALMVPEEDRPRAPQDGFYKLCDGWLAYIIEDVLFTPAVENYPCRIMETPVTYLMEYVSISLPKNFPLTEQIRIGNSQARSFGIKDCWEKATIREARPMKTEKDFSPVTWAHVAPMFAMLFAFIVLAWVILGLEVIHCKVMLPGKIV